MAFNYLIVLDFEATCADVRETPDWKAAQQEIIEFPAALISVGEQRIVSRFGEFVRPVLQPTLTPFCTALTSIRQEYVSTARTINEVTNAFAEWLARCGVTSANACVVTCGDWDLLRMWPRQVKNARGLRTPEVFGRWCNLKRAFSAHTGGAYSSSFDMMEMLAHFGMPHEGTHHRGKDDVENLSRVALRMLQEGHEFTPTH